MQYFEIIPKLNIGLFFVTIFVSYLYNRGPIHRRFSQLNVYMIGGRRYDGYIVLCINK